MQIETTSTPPGEIAADALVIGIDTKGDLGDAAGSLDDELRQQIKHLVSSGEITGRANEVTALLAPRGVQAAQVVIVGLGPRQKIDAGIAHRASGSAAKSLASKKRERVAFALGDLQGDLLEAAVAGAIIGSEGQDLFRKSKKLNPPETVLFATEDTDAVARGRIIGESINFSRRLINTPADRIYPASLAHEFVEMAEECGLEAEVWDRAKLEAERCGALLAVSRGSDRDPRLVIIRMPGSSSGKQKLALVGKGVTFDSGGLSLKPTGSMMDMKLDMSGAATMMGTLRAVALLAKEAGQKPTHDLVAVVGLVENMTGPNAYKLGDVLESRQGTTIEVHNTDAEGRLVLADALDVAVSEGATHIVDAATLTGACMVALGLDTAGLMSNNQPWCDQLARAAAASGELAWQLPMFSEFDEDIESQVADIKNVGNGRYAGAITAAKLLERFVGDTAWTHIDIAGPAFRDKPKAWCDAGASGAMIRSLVKLVSDWN